jgi:thymidylate synthase (FAD)
MQLQLVAWTPQPDRTCAAAARLCYSDEPLERKRDKLKESQVTALIDRVLRNGHLSVLEHACFTFSASGLSRACTHQLVRHRLASYSQQSQRHICADRSEAVIPPSVRRDTEAAELFRTSMAESSQAYAKLLKMGIPLEDARYLLPQAFSSRILFTMNGRQLRHFFHQRCCERAQWEIRGLAWLVLQKAQEVAPRIFALAGPPCFEGPCPEVDSPCWRERSSFFRSCHDTFIRHLATFHVSIQERRLIAPALRPDIASRLLGVPASQVLWPAWVKDQEKIALLLSVDLEEGLERARQTTGDSWVELSQAESGKRGCTGWATPWLPSSGASTTLLWDERLLAQDSVFFNLGSPWRYGSAQVCLILQVLRELGLSLEMV